MPNSEELPLDDLSVFLAVLRDGGFRAAAKRLNRSPSTRSETVSRLEARLGTPLLTRSTRTVRPTDAGAELAERPIALMAQARDALETVTNTGGGRPRLSPVHRTEGDDARHPDVAIFGQIGSLMQEGA